MASPALGVAKPRACTRGSTIARGLFDKKSDKLCKDVIQKPAEVFQGSGKTFKVTLMSKGESKTIECPDDMYILEAADKNGIDLPACCRGGICGACVARVAEGAVDQSDVADLEFTLEPEEIEAGMALLCMSRPTSDVSIETQCDWGVSLGFKEWQGASGKFESTPEKLMGNTWVEMTEEERASAEAAEETQTVSAKA